MASSIQHPHRHVWDFWYHFDRQSKLFHIFYLNSDQALVASGQHHYASCIGHATTPDFIDIDWGDTDSFNVLKPPADHWANTCLWSGDIIAVQNGYLMVYTSRDSRQDDGMTQSLGVAYTSDLFSHQWQFFKTQIRAKSAYQTKGLADDLTIHAWRDPFLFRLRDRRQVFMLVSAKTLAGPMGRRGAIALLQVTDDNFARVIHGDHDWNYLTPLLEPCGYSEMEVPQIYQSSQGCYELVFSCWAKYDFSPATKGQGGFQGVTLAHPWATNEDNAQVPPFTPNIYVLSPETQGLYACRIVPELDGEIIGFDIQTGGIRRSGIQAPWSAMDRDFSDLAV